MSSDMNLSKINIVEWFVKYFHVYIKCNYGGEKYDLILYQRRKTIFEMCSFENRAEKKTVNLDFTYLTHLPGGGRDANPYESFSIMQKVIYKDFFKNLPNVVESKFQLLIEMTVEFVKTETSEGENFEQEVFFSGDTTSECAEQRSVKEYFPC